MNPPLYLAWQYLRYHWVKSLILIISISLVLFIPMGLNHLVNKSAKRLTSRAAATPLLAGTRGSATDLTLNALYFKEPVIGPLKFEEFTRLQADSVTAIPLYTRFESKGFRIVGTSLDYLKFRGLELASGRPFAVMGECVLGAAVASSTGLVVNETLVSTPAGAFDVAGSFPLEMNIAGILAPSGTPDDQAIFVDLKTSWLIAGLAHGHQDVVSGPDSLLLARTDSNVVANASVLSYTKITPDNLGSFHFHGDISDYPLDAMLVLPKNRRESIQLRGQFEERTDNIQLIVPLTVVNDLVDTMFSVRDTVVTAGIVVGLAALAIVILVFWLSIKLRQPEINTMRKIGGAGRVIHTILGLEIGFIIGVSILASAILVLAFGRYGLPLLEGWITN